MGIGFDDFVPCPAVFACNLRGAFGDVKLFLASPEKRQDEYETKVKMCQLDLAAQKKKAKYAQDSE
nr:hypothetical protein HAGR004_39890 [Bdellovibrio sp. HAGR004]